MTTTADLISECSAELHGWGSTQDRVTPLTTSIAPGDTSFTVDFTAGQAVGITPGVVEIDEELLYVTSVNQTNGVCTLANGFGRGFKGTTPAAHTAGALVVSRPKFPRIWLLKQINEIIGAVFPKLYAVKTFTGTVTYPSNTYTLPSRPTSIIDAQWQDPVGNWQSCRSYKFDPYDGTFRLGSGPMIGRPLRIIYATKPSTVVNINNDFTTETGLPLSSADVLRLGVVAKQLPGIDISRAQTTSVEQSDRNRVVAPGAGVAVAKYVMAEFQERLATEAAALRKQYRSRTVRTF